MRILQTIRSLNPEAGGTVEGVKQLGEICKLRGNQIDIASLDSPTDDFLNAFTLPVYPLGPGSGTYGFSKRYVPWLNANINKYDIVIVNGIWQYSSFGAWRALHKSAVPYVVFTHGMLDPWFKRTYPVKHLKKWLYWPWAEYRVLRDASAVLFTCEEEKLLARKSFWLYSVKEQVITFGTAKPVGEYLDQKQQFLCRYPHLRGKRIALFMGRLHPKKGCDLALKAFSIVLAADPAWQLVMAGPDQVGWQDALKSLASELNITDRITWTGMITGDLKLGALHTAEFLFLPSHQENFGIVIAEALACGVPALISDKINIWREIIQDGAGLAAPDDVAGASSLLEAWVNLTSFQRTSMRERAQNSFDTRFEISNSSRALLRILESLVQVSNSGYPNREVHNP